MHFTNNRLFDVLVALPLAVGGYCGIVTSRSKEAHVIVRALGVLATIVCVPFALGMLIIAVLGLH